MIRKIKKSLLAIIARVQQLRKPLHLEFILTDHCNLNCKGCTHYSPLAPAEYTDFELLKRSMHHLGRIGAKGIERIFLIGGEPLLYPRLTEAIAEARAAFPNARLHIFTNGLLLPRMNEDFWEACRKAQAIISLTRYPVNFDYDAVLDLIRRQGVAAETFGDRSRPGSFFRFGLDPEGKRNPRESHLFCYNFGCLSVIGNKLYPCSTSGCVSHLNRYFNTRFTHTEGDSLTVDAIRSIAEIKRFRNHAVPFCRYCIVPYPEVAYSKSGKDISEWVD